MSCTSCNSSSCGGCGPWVLPTGLAGLTGATGPAGPAGPAGANGSNGTNGTTILYSSASDSPTTPNGVAVPFVGKTYTLPGGTLNVDNNFIEIDAWIDLPTPVNAVYNFTLKIGTVNIALWTKTVSVGKPIAVRFKGKVIRTGAASQRVIGEVEESVYTTSWTSPEEPLKKHSRIDLGLTMANAQVIEVVLTSSIGTFNLNEVICKMLTVTSLKQ